MGHRLAIAIAIAFSRIASRHIKRRHLGAPPTTSNIIGVHTLELLALDMQIRVARQPLVASPVLLGLWLQLQQQQLLLLQIS